jgi:hypothetical protein
MERKLLNLTEQQQKRANTINEMIARGVMPPVEELRATRHVLACGCPERLLRSVVEKNARITRARANGSHEFRSGVTKREFYFPSIADMNRKARRSAARLRNQLRTANDAAEQQRHRRNFLLEL